MMSLVSGEHNTPALSLQDEIPWSGACGLTLQQSLGHLDATIIYPMACNLQNQFIPAVYIVMGARDDMRLGNGMEMNPG